MTLAPLYDLFGPLYGPVFMRKAALAMFLLSIAASGTGVLVVSRRMAFFPDAAGHTVFAGLALGLIFGLPPAPAVLCFGVFIGVLIIWLVRHSNLASDTVIGLVFSGGVALGL
ncbi:MAG: metal ABC transporter permease, partial [Deltaproteobacteria bacterium]|nr:metal ABC transporter permease [Deltaproteobacteria bacterium]